MTPFTNPGDGLYQTHLFTTAVDRKYTYYVSCQGADGSVTPAVKVEFSTEDKPSPVVASLQAIARSATSVQVGWASPDVSQAKEYRLYRDGVAIARSYANVYIDRDVKPGTLYRYAVAAVYPSGEQPRSSAVPAMTLRANGAPVAAAPVVLENFEAGDVRVVNPNSALDTRKYLWSVYPWGDLSKRTASTGKARVSGDDVHSGRYSLKATTTGEVPAGYQKAGGMYVIFYPYTESDNHWHWMREYAAPQWKLDTYNRLRFWIKVPPSFAAMRAKVGQANTQVGTYVRSTGGHTAGSGGQESGLGGNHFYHYYNIPYTGEWHQVILDSHPTHMRGGSGGFEWGNMPYPTGEAGHNYFDLMTTFYLDLSSQSALPSYPSDFYFDDFELYVDTNAENVDQVLSLNGVYVPARNEIFVGWRHPKGEDKTKYEVRYSFDDIHVVGWDKARPVPNGVISPVDKAYAGMEYSTTDIAVTGHNQIMIAIKPQDSRLFRQIVIPVRRAPGGAPAR
jgi:hypothetical protein